MKLNLLVTAFLLCAVVVMADHPLYVVKYITNNGTVSLTAKKVYNVWDNSGNSTEYTVDIESPMIVSTSQEIRVAIQWQWKTRLGTSSERVAFYG